MNEVYYYLAAAPFLCGKLPTGFKIQTKTHFQPKGSTECIKAIQLPALGLSGGLWGPGQGYELKKKSGAQQYLDCVSSILPCSRSLFLKFSSRLPRAQPSPEPPQTFPPSMLSQRQPQSCSRERESQTPLSAAPHASCSQPTARPSVTSFHAANRTSRIKASSHLLAFGLLFLGLERK